VRPFFFAICILLLIFIPLAGCTGTQAKPSYSVDDTGKLTLSCPLEQASEVVLVNNETYTKSKISFHTQDGDVTGYLAAPEKPVAAVVYVPGAGETIESHGGRMLRYAEEGYAFLFIDVRGNGGESAGLPFSQQLIQSDYAKFTQKQWPQSYLTICDISSARRYLADRFDVPVYVMGSSNGGRYAAVAAGADPQFSGYVGISTSDWGIRDAFLQQGITGDALRFVTSLEPGTYLADIPPRPVWFFHSESDGIIPIAQGRALYDRAREPKNFTVFGGAHGINTAVDDSILSAWAQIYGTRG
jgi:dienelactone hydrolase